MDQSVLLADHIDAHVDDLLTACRAAVEFDEDGPEIGGLTKLAFADDLPDLLNILADRLRGRRRPGDAQDASRRHGRVRWRQGYDIRETAVELAHLRATLRRATFEFAASRDLGIAELEPILTVVDEVIDEAIADSTSQHQSEELLRARSDDRRSEGLLAEAISDRARLETLLENLPVPVWVIDLEGRVVGVNAEATDAQGRSIEPGRELDILGNSRDIFETYRLDGTPHAPGELPGARALAGLRITQEELLWRTPRGLRNFLVNAAPLRDDDGRPAGAVVAALDVTETRAAEREVDRQAVLIAAVAESMAEGLAAIDDRGRITYLNPAAERLLGWTEAELLGRDMHESIHVRRPDGSVYPHEDCPIWAAFRGGRPARGDEALLRRDGSTIPVAFTLAPFGGAGGAGAVLTFNEISERKRLESELADATSRLAAIVECSPVLMWRCGPEGRCDFINASWREFAGDPPDGQDAWPLGLHPEDGVAVLAEFRAAVASRGPFELTYRRLRADGQYRWLVDRAVPYRGNGGEFLGYIGSAVDMTDDLELRRELDGQRALAERSSRHKTRLVTALSHDARTPLNAVVLSAELLEMQGFGDDPEVAEALRTIRHGVRNVLDLLNDLLDLGRLEAGAEAADPMRFELVTALEECLGSVEAQARHKGLEADLDPDGLDGLEVETDRAKLKQIVGNLLSNALRYTDRGRILLRASASDGMLRIEVQDTGPGIVAEDQERIFEEFARVDSAARPPGVSDAGTGLGLGLAICRRLATLLEGRIELASTPSVGSTFALVLPVTLGALPPVPEIGATAAPAPLTSVSAPEAATTDPTAPRDGTSSRLDGPILVADDHAPSRSLLIRVLRRLGYEAEEAADGRGAIERARAIRPRAVIMDLHMPGMSGVEAATALRSDPDLDGLPILALTGDLDPANRDRLERAGFRGFLAKPVTVDAISRALAEAVGAPRSGR